MTKINKSIFYIILTLFLYSCNSLSDVGKTLRNEKTRTTDEFLVKKREPLTLPPDYKKLPEPRQNNSAKKETKDKISEILKIPENQNTKNKSSSVEQSIINEIRK
ncbi:DUF3035 domain-containing protein [Pelagibacteraceae bacterium]|nr:DUF3035 domain-containing protein [Pelagibacteraceae bacterium]